MSVLDYIKALGLGCLIAAVLIAIACGVYFLLRRRPIQTKAAALVGTFITCWLFWLFTRRYGDGPDSPLLVILPLGVMPIGSIFVGIGISLIAPLFNQARRKD
jgi:hypothetical protein